jgi:hypothetical protein
MKEKEIKRYHFAVVCCHERKEKKRKEKKIKLTILLTSIS